LLLAGIKKRKERKEKISQETINVRDHINAWNGAYSELVSPGLAGR